LVILSPDSGFMVNILVPRKTEMQRPDRRQVRNYATLSH
jgi:hypothetical protein